MHTETEKQIHGQIDRQRIGFCREREGGRERQRQRNIQRIGFCVWSIAQALSERRKAETETMTDSERQRWERDRHEQINRDERGAVEGEGKKRSDREGV